MSFVVTKTPYRISFFGGGTDYPDWYRKEGGQVLSTSIDKYCYVTCRFAPKYQTPRHRIVWASIEIVPSIADIRHPVVREALTMLGYDDSRAVEIIYHGELPARSGMGSSSTFAAGLIQGLATMIDEPYDQHELYRRATELERDRLGEHVGSQDQIAVCCGGMNVIRFGPGDKIEVKPLKLAPDRKKDLADHLMLVYLGRTRIASDIAGEVIQNLSNRRAELRQIHDHVDAAVEILRGSGDIMDFGRLLNETWHLKRQLGASVSNDKVDDIYTCARQNGAVGGKLLGAGGTGFMLLFAAPDDQAQLANALAPHTHLPFQLEGKGCRVVVNEG